MRRLRGTAFCDSKHVYTWAESPGSPLQRKFVSVTTVLKCLNKPALPRWASRSVAEYVADAAMRVKGGKMPGREFLALCMDVEALKGVPWAYAEKRKAEGTVMHDIAERIIGGEPLSPSAFDPRVADKISAFRAWLDRQKPEYEYMEAAVFSREHGYAGTLDAVVNLGGRRLVLDYKDSKESYPEHALQLAAYRAAEFLAVADGSEEPMPATDGGAILLIQPEGCRLVEWDCGPDMFEVFRSLIGPAAWMRGTPRPLDPDLKGG